MIMIWRVWRFAPYIGEMSIDVIETCLEALKTMSDILLISTQNMHIFKTRTLGIILSYHSLKRLKMDKLPALWYQVTILLTDLVLRVTLP